MGTGVNTILALRVAMLKVARRLRSVGVVRPQTRLRHFRVGNLLASYALPFPLQLQQLAALAAAHHVQIDIDPERFPGARIKVPIGPGRERQVRCTSFSASCFNTLHVHSAGAGTCVYL